MKQITQFFLEGESSTLSLTNQKKMEYYKRKRSNKECSRRKTIAKY